MRFSILLGAAMIYQSIGNQINESFYGFYGYAMVICAGMDICEFIHKITRK